MAGVQIIPEMVAGEYIFRRYGATVADYEHAANEDTRLELIDGVLIMHSPASVRHERLFRFLANLLQAYVAQERLGEVLGSRTAMILEDERRFEPDILFIKNENLHRLGDVSLSGPADLVIEILSPATRDYDLDEKREAYADGRVPEYWIIDPIDNRFYVDRPAGKRHCELADGRYNCPAIAGFWLDVSWLWQSPPPDPNACLQSILQGA